MDATVQLVDRNRLSHAYIRPVAFFDAYSLDVWPRGCPVSVAIAGTPRGSYLGEGVSAGVRVCISSVRRFDDAAIPVAGKSTGQYVNSVRAVQDAQRRGFDEALFLNQRGEVAEGSGENLFVVNTGTVSSLRLRGNTRPCYNVIEVVGNHVSISRRHPFHGQERIIQFSIDTFEYEKYTGRIEREVTTRG